MLRSIQTAKLDEAVTFKGKCDSSYKRNAQSQNTVLRVLTSGMQSKDIERFI
jgi:hypothetical protein